MKVFNIAMKDLLQQFRSTFAIGMMFVAPLLITGLLYLAFGGLGSGSGGETTYSLPVVRVVIANQDRGEPGSGVNAGKMLSDVFNEPALKDVIEISEVNDPQAARDTVDRREAAVAVLVPENFSRAVLIDQAPVEVTLYQDPTLTFGPGLVKEIVAQFVDGFSGTLVAKAVMEQQFKENGQLLDPALTAQAQMEYGQYLQDYSSRQGQDLSVAYRSPALQQAVEKDPLSVLMGPVMAGMLIFFVFFTAMNTASTILKEQEDGTLARMFSTPTPISVILGGKYTSIFLLLTVQSLVLLVSSALLFKIQWGGFAQVGLVLVGLITVAAGAGILVISFAKNSRQAGPLLGGLLTLTAMAGGLFTSGFQNLPKVFEWTALVVPQGWAMRGLKLALSGAGLAEVVMPVGVMLAMGAVFFALGAWNFRNRFA